MKDSIFESKANDYDDWFVKHFVFFQNEVNAIKKLMPQVGEGLEIGVGTGRFADALGIKNGIDPSIEMASLAKKRGIKVEIGVAEDLPYQSQSFDFILMVTTICFLTDIPKALEEVYRVLKGGGKLLIGMIDKESALGIKYQNQKSSNPWYRNAHFHSIVEITQLLKNAGFEEFSYVQTLFEENEKPENPVSGYGKGGFVVIRTGKNL